MIPNWEFLKKPALVVTGHRKEPKVSVCPRCGKQFEVPGDQRTRKYCSKDCTRLTENKQARQRAAAKRGR